MIKMIQKNILILISTERTKFDQNNALKIIKKKKS